LLVLDEFFSVELSDAGRRSRTGTIDQKSPHMFKKHNAGDESSVRVAYRSVNGKARQVAC
jgi:hypothetical protein